MQTARSWIVLLASLLIMILVIKIATHDPEAEKMATVTAECTVLEKHFVTPSIILSCPVKEKAYLIRTVALDIDVGDVFICSHFWPREHSRERSWAAECVRKTDN